MKRHIAKSLLLFPALLLAFTTFVQAQVSQYSFMYGPSAYTPLSGATALIAPGADNETTALKGIGFVFTFDGTPYTDFSAGSNGFITLGSIISGTGEVNRLKGASLPVIAPLWDNLKVASAAGSGVYYAVQGTAPDRVLVVEWRNMLWDRSASALPGPTISFQLRLRETANTIEFLYHNGAGLVSNTAGASIGLAGIPGPNQGFISVSHALPLPAASHTAEDTTVNTKPVTDIVYSFLPNLPVNPSVEQVTGCVLPGSANQPVLSLNMYNPSQEGALRLTSLTFSIDNTTSAADIDNAKIFGGTGPDFASAVPVGLPVLDPDGIFSFTPDHPLRNGDNYFWLVYDISAGAPADNMIGARLMSYSVNSFTTLAELPSLRPGRVVRLSAAECLLSPPCAEGSRNWVQHTFYNGSGIPVKEARTYSDLLGRVSQVQEKIFSRGNVRAVQTLYDAFGRPVLQTLPAPTESGIFCYKSNFITNSLHNTYSYKDFDEGARVSSPDPVSEASLLGSYYSNSGRESFVGRTAFPYARTEYFPDPLCRIKRISQAGEQLRMGSGHEKKMYYLSSAGEHLYVYGTNGGYIEGSETDAVLRNNSRQLYKTVAIDENGLETVSFTNTSGQTVATCVSGQSSTCTPQKVSSPLGAHGQTSLDIHLPGSKKGTLYIQQPAGSSASSYVIRIYDLNTGAELSSSHYNLSFSSTTLKTKVNFTGSYAGSGSLFLRISYTCTDASQAVCRKVPVLEYELDYSYWTLHYYDQRGRLVRTIQPNGVNCSYDPLVQATYFRTAACTAMAASLPADIYTRNLAARTGFDHTISLSVRAHAAPAGADYCTSSAGPYGGSSSGDLTVLSGQDHIATAAEVIPPDDSPAIQPDPRGDPFLPPLVARLYTIKYRIKYNVYGVISSVRTLLNPRPLEALVDISVYSDNSIAYNTDKGEVFFTIAESQASVYSSFAVNVAEVKVLSDKGAWVPYNASDPLHAYLNAFTVSNSETYTAKLTGSSGFVTTYAYNARNWLVKKVSPDEGTTEYKYDREGKLRFSQNSRQRLEDKFSYTAYDMAGRVMETGEYLQHSGGVYGQFYFDGTAAGSFGPSQAPVSGILEELNGLDAAFCRQRNRIDYDIPSTGLDLGYTQTHLLGKPGRMLSDNSVTWLSYDELGRLKWRGENLPDLGLKTMDYTLDFRGNVIRAAYQKDTPQEALFHHYGYDADERLLDVSTSHSGLAGFTLRSRYLYYLHGPLKRAELGGNLQGVDYVYTINGWLKSINNGARSPARDPGRDGLPAGLKPALFSSDVFGMTLDYFDGDYSRTGTLVQTYRNETGNPPFANRYNGLVKAMRWETGVPAGSGIVFAGQNLMYGYNYDAYNRISEAVFGTTTDGSQNGAAGDDPIAPEFTGESDYALWDISYDLNGNLKTLKRNGSDNTPFSLEMDKLTYAYASGTNRLGHIVDAGSASTYTDDLKTQAAGNYQYDATGQQVRDTIESSKLEYDVYGRVVKVRNLAGNALKMSYLYNAAGHRVKKTVYDTAGTDSSQTWYANDAQGNVRSVYIRPTAAQGILQSELPLYGPGRIGVLYNTNPLPALPVQTGIHSTASLPRAVYELKDHLGNVRAAVSRGTGGLPEILSVRDYYPHGSLMPGRSFTAQPVYRYDYQGIEKDENGWNAFELRMLDTRTGRWSAPDPKGQYHSPYISMGNNPVSRIDPDGGMDWATMRLAVMQSQLTANGDLGTASFQRFEGQMASGDRTLGFNSAQNYHMSIDGGEVLTDEMVQDILNGMYGELLGNGGEGNGEQKGASAGEGPGKGGINQSTADDISGITGGFSTIFGTAARYSGYIGAAAKIGFVGTVATGGAYFNSIISGQAKPSHHLDAFITGTLTIGALIPVTAPFAIPIGFMYGGGRIVGGAAFDGWFNNQFTPSINPNRKK